MHYRLSGESNNSLEILEFLTEVEIRIRYEG
jgi:hypothetical protein